MNFFEHQEQAQRKTVYLIFLFAIAIIGMILAIYAVVAIVVYIEVQTQQSLYSPEILAIVAFNVLLIVGLGSGTKILQLRGGGKVVASSLGARLVHPGTYDKLERQLLNVVEEMAIASGVSVPQVYIMDREAGINAFAAGFTVNDAIIGVTKGCLTELERDELQGVIAHEFSHIIYGDMRLNLYLMGVIQGILLIHIIGRQILHMVSNGPRVNRKKQGLVIIASLAVLAIGYIGFICGRMIKSAISRQREFLADASAVQLTRNPLGLSNALRKIGDLRDGSQIRTPTAEEASHLFFGEAISSFNSRLFATHPSLTERIERLENLPTGTLQGEAPPPAQERTAALESPETPGISGLQGGLQSGLQGGLQETTIHVDLESIVEEIGNTDSAHLNYAQSLLVQLPERIKTALTDDRGCQAIIYGLFLNSQNREIRQKQIAHLKATEPSEILNRLWQIVVCFEHLNPRYRLPLIDLTIPVLRHLSTDCYQHLSQQLQTLINTGGKLSLSEYTLQAVLFHRLAPYFHPHHPSKPPSTHETWNDCLVVLSGLAKVGYQDKQQAIEAFQSGLQRLRGASNKTLPNQLSPVNLSSIRRSLKRLINTTPKVKQRIVDACAHTVLYDREVNLKQAELLRTIIILLDCPIPPFLETLE
ncbi:MAG: M48 family metallopeptidase [Roseofilum sp. SBFL]|uniref:M48 family metallopeptidase n=1 Tax=unclassified Roseofilum TaxID=2620099 RepID=UPI001B1130D9|nr:MULTISPECIES: M48 family metallopeptidase [unclassified Roseofilum]MBP0026623.1 M48 family metallopeptidase [Roseofilum sp. SID2]MBP0042381.1 M48 family metallopeptidase [Roseofilum sp. SBFL]